MSEQDTRKFCEHGKRFICTECPKGIISTKPAQAEPAPQQSSDKCDNCGNELFEGHYSRICHKPGCWPPSTPAEPAGAREFWAWAEENAVNGALRIDDKWRVDDVAIAYAAHVSAQQTAELRRYAQHLEGCSYREWECSQPGCGETHTTPCSCGLEAALKAGKE